MSGVGATFVIDKAWQPITTYNSSSANGVTAFRLVKAASGGTIDLATADTDIVYGVVQEALDQTKVASGKYVVDVRMMGITRLYVTTASSIVLGSRVTTSTGGGVKLAAVGDIPVGIAVGITGTIADGDLIEVLLTPGMTLIA